MRGIVVEKFDITDERGAREHRFKQIVTQQSLVRHTIAECLFESINIVETFPCVDAFAEKVLIQVGGGRSIGIDTGVAREHSRK